MWNYEIIVKFNLLRLIFVCNLKREREFSLAHSFFVYLFRCKHSKRKIQRKNIFTSKSKHNGGSLIRWEGFCCCSLNLKPLKRCNYTWKFMLPLSILCIIHWLFYDCQNILFMESTSLKLNYWNRFVFLSPSLSSSHINTQKIDCNEIITLCYFSLLLFFQKKWIKIMSTQKSFDKLLHRTTFFAFNVDFISRSTLVQTLFCAVSCVCICEW